MDDLHEWLLVHAQRNARTVFNTRIDDFQTTYFGHSSPQDWIDSLSNEDLIFFNQKKEYEK